jgi:hypothetical protein
MSRLIRPFAGPLSLVLVLIVMVSTAVAGGVNFVLVGPPIDGVTWPTILQTRRSTSRLPSRGPVFEITPAEAVSQAEPRGYAAIIRG